MGNNLNDQWLNVLCTPHPHHEISFGMKKVPTRKHLLPHPHIQKKTYCQKKKKKLLGSLKSLPLDHNTHNPSLWSHLLGLSTPLIHRKSQHQSFCPATPMIIPEDFNSNIFSQVLHFLQINLFFHPISVTSSHNHTPNCHVQQLKLPLSITFKPFTFRPPLLGFQLY